MVRLERIVVPTDFSENSLISVARAGALARRFQSQVTLLHVNEFVVIHPFTGPLGFGVASKEAIARHLAARRKVMEEFGVAELSGVSVKRLVCSGDPARVVVERAREEQADLIVMPTRGGGVFRPFLLGSVTAKVLHDAECPVWTGAHVAEAPRVNPAEIRQVLCAVDFGPQSSKVIAWAAGFAEALDAKLTVVHAVLETPANLPDRYAFQWHSESHTGAGERLHQLLLDCHVRADALVACDGDVPGALADSVNKTGAGLLVIGRSGTGGAVKRPGSQTYHIICRAPCPVVSI